MALLAGLFVMGTATSAQAGDTFYYCKSPGGSGQFSWVFHDGNGKAPHLVEDVSTEAECLALNEPTDPEPKVVVAVPAAPGVNDPCGLGNATWTVPENSTTVTWVVVDGHLIARTVAGVVFEGGATEHDFGIAPDSGGLCDPDPDPDPVSVSVPTAPGVNDPCGPGNATWIVPADSSTVTWAIENVNGEDHLVARTVQGVAFTDETTMHDFGTAPDSGVLCSSTPVIPSKPPVVVPPVETPEKPGKPAAVVSTKADVDVDCDVEEVVTTTTTTTTDWVYAAATNSWVPGTPEVVAAVETREATVDDCPVEVAPVEGEQPAPVKPTKPAKPSTPTKPASPVEVKGDEGEKPRVKPVVAAQPEALPTAVDAGFGPAAAPSESNPLGQGLVGGGLLMLLLAGSMWMGRRQHGVHEL